MHTAQTTSAAIEDGAALDLLASADVGRLCVMDGGVPVAFPVSFRVERWTTGARVRMRVRPTSIVGRYEGPASLEVDAIDPRAGTAWSVIVRGRLHHTVAEYDRDPTPFVDEGRSTWIALDVTADADITARSFVRRPPAADQDAFVVEWQG